MPFPLARVAVDGAVRSGLHNERIRRRELRKVIRQLRCFGKRLEYTRDEIAYTAAPVKANWSIPSRSFHGTTTHARGGIPDARHRRCDRHRGTARACHAVDDAAAYWRTA
jgi:hypothetical protein